MDCNMKGKHFREFELPEQQHANDAHGHDDHPQRHCLMPQEIYDHIADAGKVAGSVLGTASCPSAKQQM